jgi:hypothetical protein
MFNIVAQSLGYAASVLLAISLMVTNDHKFRWLNTLGCLAFILYGLFIQALPVVLTNSLLLLINLYYLVKIYRAKETFDLLEFKGEETLVKKFISFYKEDIDNYFPGYMPDIAENDIKFVVLRDLVIANMFIAAPLPGGIARVKLNYTVPKYRDYKVGKFIFEKEKKFLISKAVRFIQYDQMQHKGHTRFLLKMGFRKETGSASFIKTL